MEKFNYVTPVEQLDEILRKLEDGIQPIITEQMRIELEIRKKELLAESGMDEDDEVGYEDVLAKHKAYVEKLENVKREATKKDVTVFKISDKQKEQILKDVSTCIVRKDPNSVYNKNSKDLYDSEERKALSERLKRINSCVYHPKDYIEAMKTIIEAINYSLEHDYSWMSKEEVLKEFNEGKIKFEGCRIPKLIINKTQQIKDPAILKGILTGDVTLVDDTTENNTRSDRDKELRSKVRNSEGISYEYNVIGPNIVDQMAQMTRAGFDTPISGIMKSRKFAYNKISSDYIFNDIFGNSSQNDPMNVFNNPAYNNIDWGSEDAGREAFNIKHNIKPSYNDMLRIINKENGGVFPTEIYENSKICFARAKNAINGGDINSTYEQITEAERSRRMQTYNQKAAEIESSILDAMRQNNINMK